MNSNLIREIQPEFAALNMRMSAAMDTIGAVYSLSDDFVRFQHAVLSEYTVAREELSDLAILVNRLVLHASDDSVSLAKPEDSLFLDLVDRDRLKLDFTPDSDGFIRLGAEHFDTAALEALQIAYDIFDAAGVFEEAQLDSSRLTAQFATSEHPHRTRRAPGLRAAPRLRGDTHQTRHRTVDPDELVDAVRLMSWWQMQKGFVRASLTPMRTLACNEGPSIERRGTIKAFCEHVAKPDNTLDATAIAKQQHRTDWLEYAVKQKVELQMKTKLAYRRRKLRR